jgi:hypothetical protein
MQTGEKSLTISDQYGCRLKSKNIAKMRFEDTGRSVVYKVQDDQVLAVK